MMNLTPEFSASLDRAAGLILQSKHVVMMAGAGLSVESGIPPFRGPGGLWTKLVVLRARRLETRPSGSSPVRCWALPVGRLDLTRSGLIAVRRRVTSDSTRV